jgi:hypothetical protein
MLACAILPFLPLIVDAHINQLGDDDFTKREASTLFLAKLLGDTDGIRNYELYLLVKRVVVDKSKTEETRLRAYQLYKDNREKYFLEYRYITIIITRDEPLMKKDSPSRNNYWPQAEKRMKSILPEIYEDAMKDGSYGQGFFHLNFTSPTKNLNVTKLKRIKSRPEFTMFWPSTYSHPQIPSRVFNRLNRKEKIEGRPWP